MAQYDKSGNCVSEARIGHSLHNLFCIFDGRFSYKDYRDLAGNQITGTLPYWKELKSLSIASFETNQLCGELPYPRPLNFTIYLTGQVFNCSPLPSGYEDSGAICDSVKGICASVSPSPSASVSMTETTTQSPTSTLSLTGSTSASLPGSMIPSQTTTPVANDQSHFPFIGVTIIIIVVTIASLIACAICGLLLARFVKRSRVSSFDYEPLVNVSLSEFNDVSSFLFNPNVPLIPPGEIEVGRKIGKGATGVVRAGVWTSK